MIKSQGTKSRSNSGDQWCNTKQNRKIPRYHYPHHTQGLKLHFNTRRQQHPSCMSPLRLHPLFQLLSRVIEMI
ncbi:Uncharacterised protein [Vibrio cholerae]|nr:Uncharacterised protein [Vibrio cholerae]